jgi:hypothetical protein
MVFLLIITCLSVLSSCVTTQSGSQGASLLAPGKYQDWHNMINELEIVQPFDLKEYSKIVIVKLDTSATPLPLQADNTHEPTKKVLNAADAIFVEGFKLAFERAQTKPSCEIIQNPSMPANDPAVPSLIINARLVQLNPGSKAARFWIGMGAGKSFAVIEGQVIDSISGNPFLKFKTVRSSAFSFTGGDYEKFMSGDVRDIGSDIATMLLYFQNIKTE